MTRLWPSVLVLGAVAVAGVLRMADLPPEVATHWNFRGEADGWSSRAVAVFGLPLVGLAAALLLGWLPRIDPKRGNFEQHEGAYWLLINAVVYFLATLHFFMLGNNLGYPVSINRVMGIGLGALLMVLGNYLTRIRQNWFLGIRTPWTLSSEKSWRETHRLGGKLFVAGGMLLVVATLITGYMPMWAMVVGLAVPSVILLIYSYVVWKGDPATEAKRH